MNRQDRDRWSALNEMLHTLNTERCLGEPEQYAPNLEKLLDVLLTIAYDRDTSPAACDRICEVMRLAFQLGRTKQVISETLTRR